MKSSNQATPFLYNPLIQSPTLLSGSVITKELRDQATTYIEQNFTHVLIKNNQSYDASRLRLLAIQLETKIFNSAQSLVN